MSRVTAPLPGQREEGRKVEGRKRKQKGGEEREEKTEVTNEARESLDFPCTKVREETFL